jgi:putative oxidoreductase
MFPQLARFTDLGLLLLRLMIGLVFVNSGYSHLKDPRGRATSIGMSKAFTIFRGIAEIAGSLGRGFWSSHPACCFRSDPDHDHVRRHSEKIFTWHTGFLGRERFGLALRSDVCLMNLVVAFTNGGSYVLMH